MTSNPVSLKQSDNVRRASEILSKGDFHSLPVINNTDELIGIVTTTDLIRYLNAQY